MARSQTRFAPEEPLAPAFKQADGDESARWEAYCALQARKRGRGLYSSIGQEVSYDVASIQPTESPSFANDVGELAQHPFKAADSARGGDPAPGSPAAGRSRGMLPVMAMVVAAGGAVIAGALLTHPRRPVRAPAEHHVQVVSAEPRAAPSFAPASQPSDSTDVSNSAAAEAPTPEDIATSRSALNPEVSHARAVRVDRERRRRPDTISRPRDDPRIGRTHEVRAIPTGAERPAVRERAAASPPAGQPGARPKTEFQRMEPPAAERPSASQRLMEYRASQAEYERELHSYDQAMTRYYREIGAERPPVPRHPTESGSALDSLSWRR